MQLKKAVTRHWTVLVVWSQLQRRPVCVVTQGVGQTVGHQSIKLLAGSHIGLCKKARTKQEQEYENNAQAVMLRIEDATRVRVTQY